MKKITFRVFSYSIWVFVLGLSACSLTKPKPNASVMIDNPTSIAKSKITNFNEALVCMDSLLLMQKVQPVYVMAQDINNYTSDRSLSSGGVEMLITTINQMTQRSRAIRFHNFNSQLSDVFTMAKSHPEYKTMRTPDFFIRGGITQHNKNAWSGQSGAGVSTQFTKTIIDDGDGEEGTQTETEDLTGSFSSSRTLGSVTLDLSVGSVATMLSLPGIYSANTLALYNSTGSAITGDLSMAKLGLSYSYSNNTSQDFNDVYRALIQVGTIELIGKLQKVPYWRCLSNAGMNDARMAALKKEWVKVLKHKNKKVDLLAQKALKDTGFYKGKITGNKNEPYLKALQEYQKIMNIMTTGVMDFDTFRMMNNYSPSKKSANISWWESASAGANMGNIPYGVTTSIKVAKGE